MLDLLERGRKRGFTAVLASLAITSIEPRVRGLCVNWFLGRSGQALDRDAMANQLGFTAKEGRLALRSMATMTFWAFGPSIAVEPILMTVAEPETTRFRAGQATGLLAPAPEAMRDIIAALKSAVIQPPPSDGPGEKPANCDKCRVLNERLEALRSALAKQTAGNQFRYDVILRASAVLSEKMEANNLVPVPWETSDDLVPTPWKVPNDLTFEAIIVPARPGGKTANDEDRKLRVDYESPIIVSNEPSAPPAPARMLNTIVENYPRNLTLKEICQKSNVGFKSSNLRMYLQWLYDSGSVERVGAKGANPILKLTADGISNFDVEMPKDLPSIIDRWTAVLPPFAAKMLRCIYDSYDTGITAETLSMLSGISRNSSNFAKGLSILKSANLIVGKQIGNDLIYQISQIGE